MGGNTHTVQSIQRRLVVDNLIGELLMDCNIFLTKLVVVLYSCYRKRFIE